MFHQKHSGVQDVVRSVAKLVNQRAFESGMFLVRYSHESEGWKFFGRGADSKADSLRK
jgi:hypothetical protein